MAMDLCATDRSALERAPSGNGPFRIKNNETIPRTVKVPAGRIFQINVSQGGVPKKSRQSAEIDHEGIVGDGHNDGKHHGGPDRALVLYSLEHIIALQDEGHPIYPGAIGENLTLSGLDWSSLSPGNRLSLNEVLIEITDFVTPCYKIKAAFSDKDVLRVYEADNPGWARLCARVLQPGSVSAGNKVLLLENGNGPGA